MKKKEQFKSKFGIIAVAAGSAVGLGNLWGFPYKAGEAGGGSFVLAYLICVILVGHLLMKAELLIGRRGAGSPATAYGNITKNKKWNIAGYLNIFTSFVIFSFYVVVAGWAVKYFIDGLNGFEVETVEAANELFGATTSGYLPILYGVVVISLTALISSFGVEKGIEKASKVLMPALIILLIAIVLYNTTLDGFSDSMKYLFIPSVEHFFSLKTWAMALGQCFFSLSLGMGALITYGNYIGEDQSLSDIANQVTIADTSVALLSGILVFPAVFTFGIEPSGGPGLIFVSLPPLFAQMPFGDIVGVAFFGLVIFAAVTSCISLLEISVSSLNDLTKLPRLINVWLVALSTAVVSIFMSLSVTNPAIKLPAIGTISNYGLFDQTDLFTRYVTLPLGGFLVAIMVGYVIKEKDLFDELGDTPAIRRYRKTIRTITLALILFLMVICAISLFVDLGWV